MALKLPCNSSNVSEAPTFLALFQTVFFLYVRIELHAHTHALLIPGLDNGGSHVTANVVNPSKRNLLRDLKKEN